MSGGILVISPEDKLFVALNIPEMVLKATPEPGINLLHDKAMNRYRGVSKTVNAYGIEELSAIPSVKSTGWVTVVRLPLEEALLSVKQLSKSLIVYNLLLIVAVVLIITAALIFMLYPLKKSSESVKKMVLGDQPLEKLPVTYKDEVVDLIDGFNSLVDTIDKRTVKLEEAKSELENCIEEIKQLSGLLPICAQCKKIPDDKGYWNNLESYLQEHSEVTFSHGLCRECADTLYANQPWYNKEKI